MAKQSLFAACKRLFRDQLSGTYEVDNNNIFLELYTQEDITNGTTIHKWRRELKSHVWENNYV